MREGWESEARDWASLARTPGLDHSHEDINLPPFLDLLPGPGRLTLDLACGEGRLGRVLASLGHRVVGIDASPTLVRLAVTHPERKTAVLADAVRLPFPDEAFDLVVAYMSLHDIDEMPVALTEAAHRPLESYVRALEAGGLLIEAIREPKPPGHVVTRDPAAERWRRIPLFLQLRAVKPG
jgi:SAM-dependent methyltransferase